MLQLIPQGIYSETAIKNRTVNHSKTHHYQSLIFIIRKPFFGHCDVQHSRSRMPVAHSLLQFRTSRLQSMVHAHFYFLDLCAGTTFSYVFTVGNVKKQLWYTKKDFG